MTSALESAPLGGNVHHLDVFLGPLGSTPREAICLYCKPIRTAMLPGFALPMDGLVIADLMVLIPQDSISDICGDGSACEATFNHVLGASLAEPRITGWAHSLGVEAVEKLWQVTMPLLEPVMPCLWR